MDIHLFPYFWTDHFLSKRGHTGIPRLWTQMLDAGLRTLEHTGIPRLWTQMLDAGLRTLDSGRWILDAGL